MSSSLTLSATEALRRNEEGDAETAVAIFQGIIDDRQSSQEEKAAAWSNLGVIYEDLGEQEFAHWAYRQAAALDPTCTTALNNLGAASLGWTRPLEAERYFRTSAQHEVSEHLCNGMGTVEIQKNRYQKALPWLNAALRLKSSYYPARWNRALVRLGLGDWEGMEDAEARRFLPNIKRRNRLPTGPEWDGKESLEGKRLLLLAEQGYGDLLMWSRILPQLKAKGCILIVEAHQPMVELFKIQPGVDLCYATSEPLPEHDLWTFWLTAAWRLGVTVATPTSFPYLFVPEKARPQAPVGKPLVGFAWKGRVEHGGDHLRSAPDEFAAEIVKLHPEIQFVSLQLDRTLGGAADGRPLMKNFRQSSALFKGLDGILSVDSAPVHLAGALARPCLCLLPWNAEWRWRPDLDKQKSSWYSTVSLAQQSAEGDWNSLLPEITSWLRTFNSPSAAMDSSLLTPQTSM